MHKKIAIIIERANIALGGAERSIFELTSALSGFDLDVHILAAKGQTEAKNIHILCASSHKKRVSFLTFSKAIKKHLTENHYDIIHSVLPLDFADIYQPRGGSYPESIIQNAASYPFKARQIIKKATSFVNLRRTILCRAEKKLCKSKDGPVVAALSEYVVDQFRKHYKIDDSRIAIICNGVRVNKVVETSHADKLRAQILANLQLKEADEPLFFLFVANNFRLKGLLPLIKAMKLAMRKKIQRPIFLIVAGSGQVQKYRWLARKLNLHKNIMFLGNVRHIQNALAVTDIAILPTFYDPASRFILEALAAAKPVITTKLNGSTDLFENNRHGLVIDSPNNIEQLAEAIAFYTNTDNIRNSSKAIIDDNLKETISITRAALELNALYDKIMKGKTK